jgi:hypothetical protein
VLLLLLLLISDIPTNSVVGFGVHKSCIALFSKQARCRPRIIFFHEFLDCFEAIDKAPDQEVWSIHHWWFFFFFTPFWVQIRDCFFKQSSTKASIQEFCLIWDSWRRHHPKEFLRLGIRQRVVASLGMICSQVSVIVLTQAKQP